MPLDTHTHHQIKPVCLFVCLNLAVVAHTFNPSRERQADLLSSEPTWSRSRPSSETLSQIKHFFLITRENVPNWATQQAGSVGKDAYHQI